MNTVKKLSALLLSLSLLLGGCGAGGGPKTEYLFAMDTLMELTAYGKNAGEGIRGAASVIKELEGLLSVTDQGSDVFAINRDGGAESVAPHTRSLIAEALLLGDMTGGALDITIYPIVKAWGFTTGEHNVPGDAELAGLLSKVNYSDVELDGSGVSLPQGVEIDLGAVAKGYAGDMAAQAMRDSGIASAILNLGGNVQTVGSRPDGSPWRVAVKNPLDPGREDYLGVVLAEDMAVVTSGGYERFFERDGETYWHIIDPATGRPADSGLVSVTVVGPSGVLCDGLSTALFVMGRDAALALWRERGGADSGFDVILVTESGRVTVTAGLSDRFTLLDTENFTLDVAE